MKSPYSAIVLAGVGAIVATVHVTAKPAFVVRIPNGANVPGVLAVGHVDPNGRSESLNSFGRAFKSNRQWWNVTLCLKDSDGDGQTNGQELGDPCCLWTNTTNPIPQFTEGVSDPGNNKSMVDPALLAKYLPCPANSPAVIYGPAPTPITTAPSPATTAPAPATTAPAPVTTAPAPATTTPTPITTAPRPTTTAPTPVTTAPQPATTAPRPVTTAPTPVTTTATPETTTQAPMSTMPCPILTTRAPDMCQPGSTTPTPTGKDKKTKTPKPLKTTQKWVKVGTPAQSVKQSDSDDSSE